jgi:hypothetical protein
VRYIKLFEEQYISSTGSLGTDFEKIEILKYYLNSVNQWIRLNYIDPGDRFNILEDFKTWLNAPHVREVAKKNQKLPYIDNGNEFLDMIQEWFVLILKSNDKFEDFKNFMEEPEIYRNTKKYNL